jgi:quercetin dioxygenase-like cupin family protein
MWPAMLHMPATRRRVMTALAAVGSLLIIPPASARQPIPIRAQGDDDMQTEDVTPNLLGAGEGTPYWTMGMLMTIKAAAGQTGGRLGVMEALMPAGNAPPFHIHRHEAEIDFILDGLLTVQCDDTVRECGPGSFIYLPQGVPHRWKAGPEGARILSVATPGGLEQLYVEVGEPAQALRLPDRPPNVAGWLALAAHYGIEVVGPPLS